MDSNSDKKEELRKLKEEERQLDEKLKQLQAVTSERKQIMEALHEYNDIKDATQMVLGQLANLHGVTVAELHEKYDLMNE
ncbi:DNA repair protein SWI5 homolog [Planococcus citri]|uniref:DNA repair protein SWI5 homolog n=1 Tax=Planococcus citri TaxID=170843 RepID=UPI0031F88A5A